MKKQIKANLENLMKALRETAKAHNVDIENWLEDGQIGIKSEAVPVIADVKSIVNAFLKDGEMEKYQLVEVGYGYITVFADSCEYCYKDALSSLDEMSVEMALPYGVFPKIKWEYV